jgi:hypothetical protein
LPQIFVRGETNDGGVVHFFVHACLSSESQDNATSLCTSETNDGGVVHFFVHACLSSESQDNATSLCTSETNEDTVSQQPKYNQII